MARIFLGIVGVAYLLLGVWCAVFSSRSAQAVGFTLKPGSGQSEFLTVYGGLEVALGLIFLWPWLRESETEFALRACLIVHGCLVLFRGISLFAFRGIENTTYTLAAVEWLIFLPAAFLWWRMTKGT